MSSTRLIALDIAVKKQGQASESTPRRLHQFHDSELVDRFVRDRHVDRQLVAKWLLMEGDW